MQSDLGLTQRTEGYPSELGSTSRINDQHRREIFILRSELETIKDEVAIRDETISHLESTLSSLKLELNAAQKQILSTFQDSEKSRRLIETLKTDNKALTFELEKCRNERRNYYSGVEDLNLVKKDISEQIAAKNSIIKDLTAKNLDKEREIIELKVRLEVMSKSLNEKEQSCHEYATEVKNHLQNQFANASLLSKLQQQLSEANELTENLKQKLTEIEEINTDLEARVQEYAEMSQFQEKSSQRSRINQVETTMLEIHSFMKQLDSIVDRKAENRLKALKKQEELNRQIENIDRNLLI